MFRSRQHIIELGGAFALYVGLLFAAAAIERATAPAGGWRVAVNLLPMVGALAVAAVLLRGIRRMDELQRRIQLDAIALSFLGTALVTFAWGFAEGAGLPHLRAFAVWPIMGALWGLGLVIAQRRYR